VLAADQEQLCRRFATPEADQFADAEWTAGAGGIPVLGACVATFKCSSAFNNWGGDHVIFVGRAERFATRDAPALLFHRGRLSAAPAAQRATPPVAVRRAPPRPSAGVPRR
jgi:flavin reductase (DIM6/NTAB) family NADH-FMN oxidoreductase RutF